jgi:hypothetical protein
VNVLRHNDISQNYKPVAAAYSLKNLQQEIAARSLGEKRLPLVATERQEV